MSASRRTCLLVAFALAAVLAPTGATATVGPVTHPSWRLTPTGSDQQFRGLDAVSRRVAWLGGSDGGVLRTVDGGRSWQDVSPPDTDGLLFRDVEAFGPQRALVLAIGPGEASRIYRTRDGGRTWAVTFRNPDPAAFYDCMAFLDDRRGLALSDPVDGRFRILATNDGGRSWRVRPATGMPAALTDEFAFAASGTCLTAVGPQDAWFATGGGARSRVFHSRDLGRTWTVADTPVRSTGSGGIFSLAFRDRQHGLAIGGDSLAPDRAVDALALTSDGGRTWRLVSADSAPDGYRSGSAWVAHAPRTALAVGPSGSDVSRNGGRSWTQFGTGSFDSVECAPDGGCWASGPHGRAARLVRHG